MSRLSQGSKVLLVVALAACACLSSAQAPTFKNFLDAVSSNPDWSTFYTIAKQAKLDVDPVWSAGNFLATFYLPTNAAWTQYFNDEGTTLDQFLNGDQTLVLNTMLQHVQSDYVQRDYQVLYDGQMKSTLLSMVNGRSKLNVTRNGKDITLNAEKSSAKLLMTPITNAGKGRIVEIDYVLKHDPDAPSVPMPEIKTAYDLLAYNPGLEDIFAILQKTSLVSEFQDETKVFTLWIPNAYAMVSLCKILNKPADEIINGDVTLLETLIKYLIVPDRAVLRAAFVTNEMFDTELPPHQTKLVINTNHNHIFYNSDRAGTPGAIIPKGKLMPQFPRKIKTGMDAVPAGNYDVTIPNNTNFAGHVMDAWLVPNGFQA